MELSNKAICGRSWRKQPQVSLRHFELFTDPESVVSKLSIKVKHMEFGYFLKKL